MKNSICVTLLAILSLGMGVTPITVGSDVVLFKKPRVNMPKVTPIASERVREVGKWVCKYSDRLDTGWCLTGYIAMAEMEVVSIKSICKTDATLTKKYNIQTGARRIKIGIVPIREIDDFIEFNEDMHQSVGMLGVGIIIKF